MGGPYEEVECVSRGGIGGIFDRVLGSDDCPGLRVGQRATGNLGAVPYEYRNRYRDGNGVYYRSDGRADLPDRRPHPHGAQGLFDQQLTRRPQGKARAPHRGAPSAQLLAQAPAFRAR